MVHQPRRMAGLPQLFQQPHIAQSIHALPETIVFEGGKLARFVLGFGQDADGELYVLTTDRPGGDFMVDVRYSLGMQKVISTAQGQVQPDFRNGVWSASIGIAF